MKKRTITTFILILFSVLLFTGCGRSGNSTFTIRFIDVGHGDAALVECDGHYMLIDGGDVSAGDKVYNVLEEIGVQRLDILALSHLHADHIGGLIKALTYATKIDLTISNSDYADTEVFRKLEHQLELNRTKIKVPSVGKTYSLGSAKVEVVDVGNEDLNDSLVLLVTYGDTRFLFTGDIQYRMQSRIAKRYLGDNNKPFKINLMKIPHHGSNDNSDLNIFVNAFAPDYAIISCDGHTYGHPSQQVLELLDQAEVITYRTDKDGDIVVNSNGSEINIEPKK